jgi:hypothetical protein
LIPPGKEEPVIVMKGFVMNLVVTRANNVAANVGVTVNFLSAVVDQRGDSEQREYRQ